VKCSGKNKAIGCKPDNFEDWCIRESQVQHQAGNIDREQFLGLFVLPAYREYASKPFSPSELDKPATILTENADVVNRENLINESSNRPATEEELSTINDIKEECMTKQGGVWYYDEDKAKTFLRAHVQREVDEQWVENAARYIRANVVPTPLREAIRNCLEKPLPNIMHLCALDAGWTNKEIGQEEREHQAVEKARAQWEKENLCYDIEEVKKVAVEKALKSRVLPPWQIKAEEKMRQDAVEKAMEEKIENVARFIWEHNKRIVNKTEEDYKKEKTQIPSYEQITEENKQMCREQAKLVVEKGQFWNEELPRCRDDGDD